MNVWTSVSSFSRVNQSWLRLVSAIGALKMVQNELTNFNVSGTINEDIVTVDVPMNDILRV